MDNLNWGFGTRAIHAGNVKDKNYGALTAPIYQTSTFVFDSCKQGGDRFAGNESGYIYSRLGNPTTSMLENKIAALEAGEAAACVGSGMGAVASVFWTLLHTGDHIVADETLYGCTFSYLSHGVTRLGVEVTFVDTTDEEAVRGALRPETRAVYLETPANPTLKICDIKKISAVAHDYNSEIKVICDNTFATPYLQRPLELGADIVIHSATKYINGHGDVIAGIIVGSSQFINEVKLFGIKDMTGSVLGPFESFLILRGLKTMEIRMQRHCQNGAAIAEFLCSHPAVDKVYYPGLENHQNHDTAARQMSDFGGMVSFELKGGRDAGENLLNNLKLCTLAVSLGDAETLIEHPASMTHSTYTLDELREHGIPEGLVRLSAGLENADDIIADLKAGLDDLIK